VTVVVEPHGGPFSARRETGPAAVAEQIESRPGRAAPAAAAADRATADRSLPAATCLILAALAAACIGGAFWPRGQLVVGGLLAAAALAGGRDAARAVIRADRRALAAAAAALAVYAAMRAAVDGDVAASAGIVALLAGTLVVYAVVSASAARDRSLVLSAVVASGAAVAMTGVVGAAFHAEPLATHDPGAWRAGGALTYPNATAALLVMVTLVAAGLLLAKPADRRLTVLTTIVLAGLLATMSRGGALALGVGVAVLVILARPGRRLVVLVAPGLGAVVGFGALIPSAFGEGDPSPVLALAGLAVGVAAAAVTGPCLAAGAAGRGAPAVAAIRARGGKVAVVLAVGAAVAVTLIGATGWSSAGGPATGAAARWSAGSGDRSAALHAVLGEIARQPVFGRGPGAADLRWSGTDARGSVTVTTIRFVHNEYLQLIFELGLVGGLLLVVLLSAVARLVGRVWAVAEPPEVGAAVAAALSALVVHSSLDFLWHLPVLPLIAAALLAAVPNSELQGERS
jgi:O-antigen ligase